MEPSALGQSVIIAVEDPVEGLPDHLNSAVAVAEPSSAQPGCSRVSAKESTLVAPVLVVGWLHHRRAKEVILAAHYQCSRPAPSKPKDLVAAADLLTDVKSRQSSSHYVAHSSVSVVTNPLEVVATWLLTLLGVAVVVALMVLVAAVG